MKPVVAAIVVAAGDGSRFGGAHRKPFASLAGRPVLLRSLDAIRTAPGLAEIVLVVHADDAAIRDGELGPELRALGVTGVVVGGSRRRDSVEAGVRATSARAEIVLVHDAARPLVRPEEIAAVVAATVEVGAAVLAVPVDDTIKRLDADRFVIETLDRASLWRAQTPQGVYRALILEAYDRFDSDVDVSDDVALVERLGHSVRVVPGRPDNLKLTRPEDLPILEAIWRAREEVGR